MKRLFLLSMTVLFALCALSCKKDVPDETPEEVEGNIVDIPALLKKNDLAAIINWNYAEDADIDHALFASSPAQYSRGEIRLSTGEGGEKKISALRASGSFSVTGTSAYNRVTNAEEDASDVTITVSASADNVLVASLVGFKWGVNYYFTIQYGNNRLKGVIATVDRDRDLIRIELPGAVFKPNDKTAGYDPGTDTYAGAKHDISKTLFDAFVAGRIINTDTAHPDFGDAAAFMAKEGKMQAMGSCPLTFTDGFAAARFSPSSKLKEALDDGSRVECIAATYCGQLVHFSMPVSLDTPDYDFLHLTYYTFSTDMEKDGVVYKRDFEGNDGSVRWWSQVFPSYFTTKGDNHYRISNRHGMAEYDVSYLNLSELAFNIVDGDDNILDNEEIENAKLSVRFTYADSELAGKPLPAPDVTSKYDTYDDLWIDNTVFYYRTCEKDFIPIRGTIGIKSGDAVFELPTRFDRPKASVKFPDIMLDYSQYAVVNWKPFRVPANPDIEIVLDEHKTYRVPLLRELKDNRPNGVSYYVINNGTWEEGNVDPSDATSGAHSSGGNGYVKGVTSREAYGMDAVTSLNFDFGDGLPKDLEKLVSVQNYKGTPNLYFDYNSQITFSGKIEIPVTFSMVNPWNDFGFKFTITIKGIY